MTRTLASPAVGTAARLVSLDVFRGVTMAGMVIVNNPGDWGNVYGPLLHADWNGWTPTDLIFPYFLFIVGVSITLSRRAESAGWVMNSVSAARLRLERRATSRKPSTCASCMPSPCARHCTGVADRGEHARP